MKTKLLISLAVISFISIGGMITPEKAQAQTATLSLSPSTGSYNTGDSFNVEIRLDTGGEIVWSSAFYINFGSQLSVPGGSVDVSSSVFSPNGMIATNSISGNQIRLEAFATNNNVVGSNLLVGVIAFQANTAGTASVAFDASSQVRNNSNVDILDGTSGGSYTISDLSTATLALSPSSGGYEVGSTFDVAINLNTGGQATDGADIHYLNYDPAVLSAVSVVPGSLYSTTDVNTIDNTNGRIDFSQTTSGGTTYTGSGTLATVTFEALSTTAGADIRFDYSAGATTDCNVSKAGGAHEDILSSVTDGRYTITVDTTAPSNVTAFQAVAGDGQISLSWNNPGDIDFVGTMVIRKIGAYPANASDGTQVYSGAGNSHTDTGLANGTTYYYTAFAYDGAPNYSSAVRSAQGSATPQATASALQLRVALEGKVDYARSMTVYFLQQGTDAVIYEVNVDSDSSGAIRHNIFMSILPSNTYDVRIAAPTYLTKRVTASWPTSDEVDMGELLAGNLQESDAIINELDWSIMANRWHTSDPIADINDDGDVNTLDWHYLNKNWLLTSE